MVAGFPFFLVYSLLTGKHRDSLRERFGYLADVRFKKAKQQRIWIHAASVGEVQVAKPLLKELSSLLPEASFILSTVTEQGKKIAQEQLPSGVSCIYAPIDLPLVVNRVLQTIRPAAYICIETELWPMIIREAHANNVKLFLLNGRISEHSFSNYLKIKGFMKDVLAYFSVIAVIQECYKERYVALGAAPDKIHVLGNAKYDSVNVCRLPDLQTRYKHWLKLNDNQPVFVAGSTHSGEEKLLISVFLSLKKKRKDVIWIVAPRHLERLREIELLLTEYGIEFDRLSSIKESGRSHDVALVDTMGDLSGLYSIATYIFCGGSLVPRGGHNIMEAAIWGKPVFYGPSMKDFTDAKELMEEADAGFTVSGPEELTEKLLSMIEHPDKYAAAAERAGKTALAQQGSAKRQAQLVADMLLNS